MNIMAVATIDDVGKCCEANTAVFYIPLVVYIATNPMYLSLDH